MSHVTSFGYFVSFQLFGVYLMMNLFQAVVLESYQLVQNLESEKTNPLSLDDVRSFSREWCGI